VIQIRDEFHRDVEAREALLDACFGASRFEKTCERLREGRLPAEGLSLVAEVEGALAGTVRLWHVTAGPSRPALLLGPLAVDPARQGLGIGGSLMRAALARAAALGHAAVLLVGDAPYYERFGFSRTCARALWLPGPYDPGRFLGLELLPGSLEGAGGLVSATGAIEPKPDLSALVAAASGGILRIQPRA
jgi:predicted N-acetyltransferase YhbS